MAPLIYLAAATGVRLLTGLAQLKYVAWQFGPANFGLMTQIMGVAAIFYTFAGGAVSWGLIRNIAAAPSREGRLRWMAAAGAINLFASAGLAAAALLLWRFDDATIFRAPGFGWLYLGIALTYPLVGLGNLILAYYSGIGDTARFAAINVAASIVALVLVIGLALGFGLVGAAAAIAFAPAAVGPIALWSLGRRKRDHGLLQVSWDREAVRRLLSYAAVLAVSAAAIPIAQLLMRTDMAGRFGWDVVAYWQAAAKLSDAYMAFIGVAFINHLLPVLSRVQPPDGRRRALWRFDAVLLAGFAAMAVFVYALRRPLMVLIYSDRFLPGADFILPQLAGDMFRIAALSIGYYFLAQGRLMLVTLSELGRGAALYLFYLAFAGDGALAAVYAHVATYAGLLAVMLGLMRLTSGVRAAPAPP